MNENNNNKNLKQEENLDYATLIYNSLDKEEKNQTEKNTLNSDEDYANLIYNSLDSEDEKEDNSSNENLKEEKNDKVPMQNKPLPVKIIGFIGGMIACFDVIGLLTGQGISPLFTIIAIVCLFTALKKESTKWTGMFIAIVAIIGVVVFYTIYSSTTPSYYFENGVSVANQTLDITEEKFEEVFDNYIEWNDWTGMSTPQKISNKENTVIENSNTKIFRKTLYTKPTKVTMDIYTNDEEKVNKVLFYYNQYKPTQKQSKKLSILMNCYNYILFNVSEGTNYITSENSNEFWDNYDKLFVHKKYGKWHNTNSGKFRMIVYTGSMKYENVKVTRSYNKKDILTNTVTFVDNK